MTLRQLAAEPSTLPTRTTWYLTDLAEARGKQELFTRQSPQRLKVLREHALIESAISSNRIEGVEVDKSRVGTLIFGKPALRDRDEEEVRGYRDALKLIHESGANLPITEQNKERYYEVLEQSSQRWHDGKHDPWPTMNFLLFTLMQACKEFEQRVGQVKAPCGAKAELVLAAICQERGDFRLADIERACPGVGREWIRTLLAGLKARGEVSCQGKGPAARWHHLGSEGIKL
jgi:hypothetical protein